MKTQTYPRFSRIRAEGFSIAELLISVVVLSILTTVGISAINRQNDAIEDLQLQQQIRSLNAAAQAFEFSGGNLSDVVLPLDVITRLKSNALVEQQEQVAGMAGSVVDLRLHPVSLPASQTDSDAPRALWDVTSKRFVYATSGSNGVERFILSDAAEPEDLPVVNRKLSTEYATDDTWVWEYTDQSTTGNSGSGDADGTGSELGDLPTTTPATASATQLLAPQFSIPGGSWEYPVFSTMVVELTNPNAPELSTVRFSVNGGPYEVYAGPINVAPDSEIAAFTQSLDPVSYTDSNLEQENYEAIPQIFEGTAVGNFTEPAGGTDMEWSIVSDDLSSTFSWGVGASQSDPSSLTFSGAEFSASSNGDTFRLGTLDYFNGTIYSGTGADQVDLQLEISFTVPETEESFTFDLSLENTPNNGATADDNADFVRIETPLSQFTTMLNGVLYGLELQFGYVGNDGFSTIDEFHVHEGSSATADVYGIFVAITP